MTSIYHYHTMTGAYLGQAEASLDPLEGKPLVPASATTKNPPAVRKNEIAVFKEGIWNIVADYRGTEYWLADGSAHTIENIGEKLPKEALAAPPAPVEDKTKAQTEALAVPPVPAEDELKVQTEELAVPPVPVADERKEQTKEKDAVVVSDTHTQIVSQQSNKFQRAQRLLAGNASEMDITLLQAECEQRGLSETPEQLAATQVAKGQVL